MTQIFKKHFSVFSTIVIAAVYLSIFSNSGFWVGYIEYIDGIDFARVPLLLGMFAILVLFFIGILTLFSFSRIFKPVVIAAIVISSGISYFIHQYGISIDKTMIQNVFETDFKEATELLNWRMFVYVTVFGIIPSVWFAGTKIIYPGGSSGMMTRLTLFTGVICVAILLLILTFKSLAPTFRQYHELRYRLTPMNLIQATQAYASTRLRTPICSDLQLKQVGPAFEAILGQD